MSGKDVRDVETMQSTIATYAAAQTDTSLIAAVTGEAIYIYRIEYSHDTIGTMFLEYGATKLTSTRYYAANFNMDASDLNIRVPSGNAVTITTTGAGNASIRIHYYTKPDVRGFHAS